MNFKTTKEIEENGFFGCLKIKQLFTSCNQIPVERGVYIVIYLGTKMPKFIIPGTGGFFKGKNPNVSIDMLNNNWVENTIVVYIGQAGGIRNGKWSNETLQSRISTYMEFGKGYDVMHYGGRYIWQIKECKELLVCWKPLPNKTVDPKEFERKLIQEFKNQYQGKRPFANLKD